MTLRLVSDRGTAPAEGPAAQVIDLLARREAAKQASARRDPAVMAMPSDHVRLKVRAVAGGALLGYLIDEATGRAVLAEPLAAIENWLHAWGYAPVPGAQGRWTRCTAGEASSSLGDRPTPGERF